MKKLIIFPVIVLLNTLLFAQSPNAFKYQAVVRDASGSSICNADVSLKFIIHQGSPTGAEVYEETHTPITTNDFGLVNLEIGNGTPVSGNFSTIEWESDIYFITVALDITGGTNYQEMGTEQLFSVPYAMHSTTAEFIDDADADPTNELQTLSINGNDLTITPNGNTVPIDGDPDNECQTLAISGNTLSISPCGNSVTLPPDGLTLPYSELSYDGGNTAFLIHHIGVSGHVAEFEIDNSSHSGSLLQLQTNGQGEALMIYNDGTDDAIKIDNNTTAACAINIDNNSDLDAIHINNDNISQHGIWLKNYSDYEALLVQNYGTDNSANIRIDNPSNSDNALEVYTNGTGYAGYFYGDVHINGTLTGSNKQFVIDHPSDPYNKILRHSCVESSEMMNIYKGRAKLVNGEVVIELPNYFDALNHPEHREINLTPVNGWSPLYLNGEIANNQFVVKTTDQGNKNQEFSWVVYAVRNDKWAQDHPLIVEEEKGENSRFEKGELIYKVSEKEE